jgi:hypothetical protein
MKRITPNLKKIGFILLFRRQSMPCWRAWRTWNRWRFEVGILFGTFHLPMFIQKSKTFASRVDSSYLLISSRKCSQILNICVFTNAPSKKLTIKDGIISCRIVLRIGAVENTLLGNEDCLSDLPSFSSWVGFAVLSRMWATLKLFWLKDIPSKKDLMAHFTYTRSLFDTFNRFFSFINLYSELSIHRIS